MTADNSDWRICRIVALTIGWIGVLMSCGVIYVICEYPGHFGNSLHETIIPFLPGINMLACYTWFFGISKIKPNFMLTSIVLWSVNLFLVFICMYSSLIAFRGDKRKSSMVTIYFGVPMVYLVLSYYVSIVCYTIMKKTAPRLSQYTPV